MVATRKQEEPPPIPIDLLGDAVIDDLIAPVDEQGRGWLRRVVVHSIAPDCLDQGVIHPVAGTVRGGEGLAAVVRQQVPGPQRGIDQKEVIDGKPPSQKATVKAPMELPTNSHLSPVASPRCIC